MVRNGVVQLVGALRIMVVGGAQRTAQQGEIEGGGQAQRHEGQAADHINQQKGAEGGHDRSGSSLGSAAAIGDTQCRWSDSCGERRRERVSASSAARARLPRGP